MAFTLRITLVPFLTAPTHPIQNPNPELNLVLVAMYMTSLPVVTFFTSPMFELSLGEVHMSCLSCPSLLLFLTLFSFTHPSYQYALQFLAVTVVSGLLLLHAYIQIASLKEGALLKQRYVVAVGGWVSRSPLLSIISLLSFSQTHPQPPVTWPPRAS